LENRGCDVLYTIFETAKKEGSTKKKKIAYTLPIGVTPAYSRQFAYMVLSQNPQAKKPATITRNGSRIVNT